MKKLSKKQLENKVSEVFRKHCCGIQFDIFDLSKVYDLIESDIQSGQDGIEAAKKAIELYGVKG